MSGARVARRKKNLAFLSTSSKSVFVRFFPLLEIHDLQFRVFYFKTPPTYNNACQIFIGKGKKLFCIVHFFLCQLYFFTKIGRCVNVIEAVLETCLPLFQLFFATAFELGKLADLSEKTCLKLKLFLGDLANPFCLVIFQRCNLDHSLAIQLWKKGFFILWLCPFFFGSPFFHLSWLLRFLF
jgi:hypothetical protein